MTVPIHPIKHAARHAANVVDRRAASRRADVDGQQREWRLRVRETAPWLPAGASGGARGDRRDDGPEALHQVAHFRDGVRGTAAEALRRVPADSAEFAQEEHLFGADRPPSGCVGMSRMYLLASPHSGSYLAFSRLFPAFPLPFPFSVSCASVSIRFASFVASVRRLTKRIICLRGDLLLTRALLVALFHRKTFRDLGKKR